MMLFVDVETTGLNPHKGLLLEVAFVVTNDDLAEISSFTTPIYHDREHLEGFFDNEWVLETHRASGLLEACTSHASAARLSVAQIAVASFIDGAGAKDLPLSGSTVGFDRSWLTLHMPDVIKLCHYRNIDVSSLKELCKLWRPGLAKFRPEAKAEDKAHRALADIRASIDELKFYRETFLAAA